MCEILKTSNVFYSIKVSVLFFALVLFGNNYIFAQQVRDGRIEIEVSSFSDAYFLLPVGNKGLLLFGQSDRIDKGKMLFDFSKYDTRFRKEWQISVPIERRQEYQLQYFDEKTERLYVLLGKRRGFVLHDSFTIIEMDINTAVVKTLNGNFGSYALVKDFFAFASVAYMGGHYYPSRSELFFRQSLTLLGLYIPALFGSLKYKLDPLLITADFSADEISKYNYNSDGNTKVIGISYDKTSELINVLISDKPDKHTSRFEVLQFDSLKNMTNSFELVLDGYELTSGRIVNVYENELIAIGTYTRRSKNYKESTYNFDRSLASPSMGLYYAKIVNGKQEFIRFYSFHTFKNFYNFLSRKALARVDRRMSRMSNRNMDFGLEYNLLVHDLIFMNNEYVMIAEAYYPEYEQRCYYQYNPYRGYSERTCYDVFIGFRFTHAIIAAFDNEGQLKWDNSFEMWDVITTNLKPQVRYFFEDDEVLLLYAYGNEIKTQVLSGHTIVEGKTSLKIDSSLPGDKVRQTIGTGIEYWYDDYFIAYGYQRIRTDPKAGGGTRRVFYFNKIQYR